MSKQIVIDSKTRVKKADIIVKARYKLNPLSLKFITTVIAGLKRGDDLNEEYTFKVKNFKELSNLKRKDLYWAIKQALKELLEKPLYIPEKDGFIMCNWVSGGHYIESAGEVRFMIYPKLRPYLLEAKKKFLRYKLENILNLRSSYSIRIYEILKDWLEINKRYNKTIEKIVDLKTLRETLEIPASYKYADIKRQILEKAKKELEQHTDVVFSYEELKNNKKVTHLKFLVRENLKNIDNKRVNNHKSDFNLWRINILNKSQNGKTVIYFDKETYVIKNGYLWQNDRILTKEKALETWQKLYKNRDRLKIKTQEIIDKEKQQEEIKELHSLIGKKSAILPKGEKDFVFVEIIEVELKDKRKVLITFRDIDFPEKIYSKLFSKDELENFKQQLF